MQKCQATKRDGKRCTYNANPLYGNLFCGIHKREYLKQVEYANKSLNEAQVFHTSTENDKYLCLYYKCQKEALNSNTRYCFKHCCELCNRIKDADERCCYDCKTSSKAH